VPAVVARLATLGLGANVVSSGEWGVAGRAGISNDRITLEGIGKTRRDLRAAVRAAAAEEPLRWIAVESHEELDALAALAAAAGLGRDARPPLEVLLRLNPEVMPETHAGLAVGAATSKFGMTGTELTTTVAAIAPDHGPLRLRGIHLHVGSQLGAVDAWRDAVRRGLALRALLGAGRPDFDTFDVGGGFPAGPAGTVPSPERFAREARDLLAALPPDRRPARLAVEPGRFLVARAGWLVCRVLHVRERPGTERVVVLDAGMTELIRPALYGARHPVRALTSLGRPIEGDGDGDGAGGEIGVGAAFPARVDGPVCESTDTFDRHELPPIRRDDLVAVGDAGAYAASMAMAYNGRAAPPQVLLEPDGTLTLGRRRGARR
jgi:diaminopimelate decarboxylase